MTPEPDLDLEVQNLLDDVRRRYGYDLSGYSRSFVRRRILNRLNISEFRSLAEMREAIVRDPQFFQVLLQDVSIRVTEMFRDPSFFMALRREVIPYLRTYPYVKIWDAGCATGEELYSLAILLKEEGLYERSRIYATDFSDVALRKAVSGIYPTRHLKRNTANYQKAGGVESFVQYYSADGEDAIIDQSLKRNVVFSNHNLVTDGVFNEMHLVLCRNVLIYFNRALQDRVIGLFHDSLCHNGFLCLGAKESLRFSAHAGGFTEAAAMREKIYRKKTPPDLPREIREGEGGLPDGGRGGGSRFEAVVIGVSAGGVKALTTVLSSLGDGFPIPVIIVQHQYRFASDGLPGLLGRYCPLKVKEAEDKERIARGTVYIAPPEYHLMVEKDGTLSLSLFERVSHARPSVDVLFESAAEVYRERLIGVILTGANDDGSRGLKRIKENGGVALVEDPASAEVNAMPRAALDATEVDGVLPLDGIGPFLEKIVLKAGTGGGSTRT